MKQREDTPPPLSYLVIQEAEGLSVKQRKAISFAQLAYSALQAQYGFNLYANESNKMRIHTGNLGWNKALSTKRCVI